MEKIRLMLGIVAIICYGIVAIYNIKIKEKLEVIEDLEKKILEKENEIKLLIVNNNEKIIKCESKIDGIGNNVGKKIKDEIIKLSFTPLQIYKKNK